MASKETLRNVYLEKRQLLTDSEYENRNALLRRNFSRFIEPLNLSSLHIFLPIIDKKEVNTWPIIHDLRTEHPGISLYTSKVERGGFLSHFLFEENTRLAINKWGIPEPEDEPPVTLRKIDAVVIPLIISDKMGQRIGYGKGYYDRFLSSVEVRHKIGVTLSPPLDCIPFSEDHDIPLSACIGPYFVDEF